MSGVVRGVHEKTEGVCPATICGEVQWHVVSHRPFNGGCIPWPVVPAAVIGATAAAGAWWSYARLGSVVWAVLCVSVVIVCVHNAVQMWRHWDRRRARDLWQRRGRCTGCGYDLRASRGECPECGRPIPQAVIT